MLLIRLRRCKPWHMSSRSQPSRSSGARLTPPFFRRIKCRQRLVSLLPGANSGRGLSLNRSLRLKIDCRFSLDPRQVRSTTKQSRWQPETALPNLAAADGNVFGDAWALSILARAYRSSSASCSRTQARVFGATHDTVPSAETSDDGCFL